MFDLLDNYGYKNLLRIVLLFKDDFILLIKFIVDLLYYYWGLNLKRCGKEYDNFKIWMDWNVYYFFIYVLFIYFDFGNVRFWYMF